MCAYHVPCNACCVVCGVRCGVVAPRQALVDGVARKVIAAADRVDVVEKEFTKRNPGRFKRVLNTLTLQRPPVRGVAVCVARRPGFCAVQPVGSPARHRA